MTTSLMSVSSPSSVPHHGHRHHGAGSSQDASQGFGSLSDVLGAGGSTAGASGAAASTVGAQGFASQLQSILLGAQQPGVTAPSSPATVASPASATDSDAQPFGAVRHLADRLQSLLSQSSLAGAAGAAAASAAQPLNSLQSVLDNLQHTLQQSLAAYQTPTASTASTLLTA